MSEVKVNKISPRTNCGTVQLGDSGDTITIPAGVTITNNGTQTGFGRTGTVDWDTTAKTASFTAVSGNGYFVNTTSGAVTVTLPATPSAGDIVAISDYASTANTNNITIGRNGSNINGSANDYPISTRGLSVTLVYVDGTRGWKSVTGSDTDVTGFNPNFIVAKGGTITCCGDYRVHTFNSPGTFQVTNGGTPCGSTTVDYLVVAAGGGGGGRAGGGAGAGGYRESCGGASGCYTTSPLSKSCGAIPVSVGNYPITIGAGGTGGVQSLPTSPCGQGTNGSDSTFSNITSAGGGGGGAVCAPSTYANGLPGGSAGGGGGATGSGAGTGNTPPVSPPQGNNGGTPGPANYSAGGGGGATAAGGTGSPGTAGAGGNGATTSISFSSTSYGGGGGGGSYPGAGVSAAGGPGGTGGGGKGSGQGCAAVAGTANTGGGGGGGGGNCATNGVGQNGGSGVVIIRYKYQ